MNRVMLFNTYFKPAVIAFFCLCLSHTVATCSPLLDQADAYHAQQKHNALRLAVELRESPAKTITKDEARQLILWAEYPMLKKLISMESKAAEKLKGALFNFITTEAAPSSPHKYFMVAYQLHQDHLIVNEIDMDRFLSRFVALGGGSLPAMCKENTALTAFMKTKKAVLLDAMTKGYVLIHNAAGFWTAWIEFIEPFPTVTQWQNAATAVRQEALSSSTLPCHQELFDRAEAYAKRLKFPLKN
jgi:hypothetical protein